MRLLPPWRAVFIEVSEKEENLSHGGKKSFTWRNVETEGIFHVNKSED